MSFSPLYMPVIRTRAAELKAYDNLSPSSKAEMLPVFELTRSRRSPKNQHGDISKNIEQIKKITAGSPFILDVTAIEQLGNIQTSEISSSPDGGFARWCEVVEQFRGHNVTPLVHVDMANVGNTSMQIQQLATLAPNIFLRVGMDVPLDVVLPHVFSAMAGTGVGLRLLLDRGFVDLAHGYIFEYDLHQIRTAAKLYGEQLVSLSYAASTFPGSVTASGYGNGSQHYGCFNIAEVLFHQKIIEAALPVPFLYADYATIHPKFYSGGGAWVPRIDFPLESQLHYYRFKREEGGYITAANYMCRAPWYSPHRSWGGGQIEKACSGEPEGKNPAHWISVRMNIHMERQLERLMFT